MAVETVKVYCWDEQVVPVLVDGVLVRVFNAAGDSFITQGYTGDAGTGIVEFSLNGTAAPSPTNYTIRLSKTGVAFDGLVLGDKGKSPQLIPIYSPASGSPTGTNNFDVYGNLFHHPVSSDPDLCRVSGFLMRPDGTAFAEATIQLSNYFEPTAVGGRAVVGRDVEVHADTIGYVEFDLYRGGVYRVSVEGLMDEPREIHVPDRDGFSFIDLLFPIVAKIVYTPSSVAILVGETAEVSVVVTASDTRVLTDTAEDDVDYTSADTDVAGVSVVDGKLQILGVSAGATTAEGARADTSITVLPAPTIDQTPIPITVT